MFLELAGAGGHGGLGDVSGGATRAGRRRRGAGGEGEETEKGGGACYIQVDGYGSGDVQRLSGQSLDSGNGMYPA